MRRQFLTASMICICFLGVMVSAFANENKQALPTAPVRISFWPDVIGWPVDCDINGLSLGLPGSYGNDNTKVNGADIAIFVSETPGVHGLQMSIISVGKNSEGLQLGIGNAADNFAGMQAGIFNGALNDSSFFQFGVVNHSRKSSGFQIGLLNFMDNGIFPVFILFNYSKPEQSFTTIPTFCPAIQSLLKIAVFRQLLGSKATLYFVLQAVANDIDDVKQQIFRGDYLKPSQT